VKHEINDSAVVDAAKLFGGHPQIVNVVRQKMFAGGKE
jgi:hypothetical protein